MCAKYPSFLAMFISARSKHESVGFCTHHKPLRTSTAKYYSTFVI